MARKKKPATVLAIAERRPAVPTVRTPPFELVDRWLADKRAEGANVTAVAIHWLEDDNATGRRRPYTWTAGMTSAEEVALAVLQEHRALDEWKS